MTGAYWISMFSGTIVIKHRCCLGWCAFDSIWKSVKAYTSKNFNIYIRTKGLNLGFGPEGGGATHPQICQKDHFYLQNGQRNVFFFLFCFVLFFFCMGLGSKSLLFGFKRSHPDLTKSWPQAWDGVSLGFLQALSSGDTNRKTPR